jgi:ABC-type multidrug transport system fused ATPase/permease subunit
MVHLISGHYRPRYGRVLANGRPYDEVSMQSVRARIALVPQNPLLFAGSVLENVAYGWSAPDQEGDHAVDHEEAVRQALDWAGAAEFVDALPEGLNTPIGELGVRLSGGQRQRLVIARALLRRPDLLILDEPTNHLDEDAVEHLMNTLDGLPFRPAILVISHELRVLRHVDRSFKLENGRLTELDPLPGEVPREISQ